MSVGDVVHTVELGPVIGPYLPIWGGQEATYWWLERPDLLLDLVGGGQVARVPMGRNRFREMGLLTVAADGRSAHLALVARYRSPDGGVSQIASVPLTRVDEQTAKAAVTRDSWMAFCRWLGRAALSAAERGELVVVESGGQEPPVAPYVLSAVTRGPDGQWYSLIETSPAPVGAEVWRDQAQSGPGQTLSAPASRSGVEVAGVLAGLAIDTWNRHPFDLALTYGPGPSGPWVPER